MVKLSVSIVSYNSAAYLPGCLDSLSSKHQELDLEVIVVDNASTDNSAAVVRQRYPEVKLIASPRNVGYGAANNLAFCEASGEYLLVLNPDTVVPPGALRILVDRIAASSDIGMIGPKLKRANGSIDLSCRRSFPTRRDLYFHLLGLDRRFPQSPVFARYLMTYLNPDLSLDVLREVDCLSGAFIIVRREILNKVGGFDERFFMFGEDLDWTYRVKLRGWKVCYSPDVEVLHYQGVSTRTEPKRTYDFYRATLQLYTKYYGATTPRLLNALFYQFVRLKLLEFMLRWNSRSARRWLNSVISRSVRRALPQ
jgi:N-acetylglucosaminyl-diphospho-decaprenol L-rhamnosyltransferase